MKKNWRYFSIPPTVWGGSIICTIALIIRMYHLDGQSLWTDEVLSLNVSRLNWQEMKEALHQLENNKPPLFYLLLHLWSSEGTSAWWLRLPSAVFSALSCGVALCLGSRLAGPRLGWIFSILIIMNPMNLWYGQEVRLYALWQFAAATTCLLFLRFIETSSWLRIFLFCLGATTTCYLFPYGFFILGFTALLALVAHEKIPPRWRVPLVVAHLLAFAAFAPWLYKMVSDALTPLGNQFHKGPLWLALGYTFYTMFYGLTLGPSMEDLHVMGGGFFMHHPLMTGITIAALFIATFLLVCGIGSIRRDRLLLTFCVGGIAFFLLGPALISILKPGVTYNPRYALVGVFPCLLAVTFGMKELWTRGIIGKWIVTAYVILVLISLGNYFFVPRYSRDNVRGAMAYISSLTPPPDVLIVSPGYSRNTVVYYYPGPAPILIHNASGQFYSREQTQETLIAMKNSHRFAYISMRPDHGDPQHQLLPWLKENFEIEEEKEWTGVRVFIGHPTPIP